MFAPRDMLLSHVNDTNRGAPGRPVPKTKGAYPTKMAQQNQHRAWGSPVSPSVVLTKPGREARLLDTVPVCDI